MASAHLSLYNKKWEVAAHPRVGKLDHVCRGRARVVGGGWAGTKRQFKLNGGLGTANLSDTGILVSTVDTNIPVSDSPGRTRPVT